MDIFQCIERIFIIVGNLSIFIGVGVAIWQVLADHNRRKKQATFEFYHSIYNQFIEPLEEIEAEFPGSEIISLSFIKDNASLYNSIKRYLSHMERFAIGINANIYDINVFKKMVGANLTIRWYDKFVKVISHIREKDDEQAYNDLDILVSKLNRKSEGLAVKAKAQEITGTVEVSNIASIESLMKRGKLFLEDSDWQQADQYFDKVLDIDPEHAHAYIGKLCAELELKNENQIAKYEYSIIDNKHYQKAVRFAAENYRIQLEGYSKAIEEHIAEERRIEQERIAKEKR